MFQKIAKLAYGILEIPAIYSLSQVILAPGTARFVERLFFDLADLTDQRPWLDVGCGPAPYVPIPAGGLIAIDLSPRYVTTFRDSECIGVVGSATELPFQDDQDRAHRR